VFPLPEGRANVGFGVLRGAGVDGKALAARWRELVDGPRLRAVLGEGASPEATRRAWPIPTRFDPAALCDGRVLFAGDAAAVVDPMTGEGIAQALETGALAATAIARGGAPVAVGDRYRRAVERALGTDLRLAGALQRVLASPTGARAALRAADLSPWTRRNFARWMFEDYPRAQLFTPRRWHRRMLTGPGAYRHVA
jgi:menaquinone-9 beta-reductase